MHNNIEEEEGCDDPCGLDIGGPIAEDIGP